MEGANPISFERCPIFQESLCLHLEVVDFVTSLKNFCLVERGRMSSKQVAGCVGIRTASIIAETGIDMSVFPLDKQLCSWMGPTTQNNESAGKKKATRIGHGGTYTKPLLVQCSVAVSKSEEHPENRNCYLLLRKRRGHKDAVIAISRMLQIAIFHVLKKNKTSQHGALQGYR